jgi:DNA-binding response OmpR family regulator
MKTKKKKKIFVIDDDHNILKLLEVTLKEWAYEVVTSDNGIDWMQIIERETPDLILLDIKLPGMDGMSICSEITTSYDMPVIMISVIDDKLVKNTSNELGASEYITKPIDNKELKTKIERFIGKN